MFPKVITSFREVLLQHDVDSCKWKPGRSERREPDVNNPETALAQFRTEQNISAAEAARRIGVSRSFYHKIESGVRNPSWGFLVKFKKAFPDASIDQVFFCPRAPAVIKKKPVVCVHDRA